MEKIKTTSEYIKTLSGHSGCEILLKKYNEYFVVEKISSDIRYNFRLKKQCKKQEKFISKNIVSAPQIYNCGYKNGLFYFDMEYVQGKTLAEYVEDVSIIEIASYIKCLFDSLYINDNRNNYNACNVFENKIIKLKNNLQQYKNLEQSFTILENFDWSQINKSPCHGDLTLENIIVSRNKKIYLIDFLDSFYNSWMIDIAKLLQDLELKWSFRNKKITQNIELKLLVAKEALIEKILKTENGFDKLNTIYHLLLLNIIRIYPYVKDNLTLNFLNNSVQYLNFKLENIQKGDIL